jgi:hypothetical protein
VYWASWGVCWIISEFGRCSLFPSWSGLRTYQPTLVQSSFTTVLKSTAINRKWQEDRKWIRSMWKDRAKSRQAASPSFSSSVWWWWRETTLFIEHFIAALSAVWNPFKGTLKYSILEGGCDSSLRLGRVNILQTLYVQTQFFFQEYISKQLRNDKDSSLNNAYPDVTLSVLFLVPYLV